MDKDRWTHVTGVMLRIVHYLLGPSSCLSSDPSKNCCWASPFSVWESENGFEHLGFTAVDLTDATFGLLLLPIVTPHYSGRSPFFLSLWLHFRSFWV